VAKISIVIATRNRAAYLRRAIASVAAQTWADWEIIIVDDGSTDTTRAEVERFSVDPRIRYLYQVQRGVSAARNVGVGRASGEYLAFLDDDDVFLPHKLRTQLWVLENDNSLGLVAGGHHVLDDTGRVLATDEPWKYLAALSPEALLLGNRFAPNSVLVHRKCWQYVGGFDETLALAEDWDLWLRLALSGCRMTWLRQVVCGVRGQGAHASSNLDAMRQAELRVLEKVFTDSGVRPDLARHRRAAMSRVYLRSAVRQYATGDLHQAPPELERAIALEPSVLDKHSQQLVDAIATRVYQARADGPDTYVGILAELPDGAAGLRRRRADVLAKVALQRMFALYGKRHWRLARKAALDALALAPGYVRNRGVVKVALVSTFHSLAPSCHTRSSSRC
jgi:glycosyltransferase involved in cell wall biosynthesis